MTPQERLIELAGRDGVSLAALSRLIGRNDAYLQQFVHRGSPRQLPERERRLLADYLGVPEHELGAAEVDITDEMVDQTACAMWESQDDVAPWETAHAFRDGFRALARFALQDLADRGRLR